MELAIICASAPAMRGFLSDVADRVQTAYGPRKYGYGSRSRITGATTNPSDLSYSGNRGTETYDGLQLDSAKWTEKSSDSPYSRKLSDELLTVPEKKITLSKGGIMVTETFSVDRDHRNSGYGHPKPAIP
jgi:hypothetical protein